MKIALNLKGLDEADVVKLANTILTCMAKDGTVTPDPLLAALAALRDQARDALAAAAVAQQAALQATSDKNEALDALRDGLTTEAATVQKAVDKLPDDEQLAAIEANGMRAQAAPTRLTSLPAVTGLSLTAGDNPGTMDWHCDPVERRSVYVIEYTTDPLSPTARWTMIRPSTASSGTITGLTSGASVSVRVHAEGTHGVVGPAAVAGPKIVP